MRRRRSAEVGASFAPLPPLPPPPLRHPLPPRLALLPLLLLLVTLLSPSPCAAFCTPPPPLPPVVRVALLVFCRGAAGILSDNPTRAPECAHDDTPRHRVTIKPFLDGLDMYVSAMEAQGAMPLSDGGNVTLSYTYINVGSMDWLATDWAPIVAAVGSGGEGVPGRTGHGLSWELADPSPSAATRWGGPYTFIVPHMYMRDSESRQFILACQARQSCMVMLPFTSTAAMAKCLAPLPSDCVHANIRDGGRRFSHALGVLWDSSYDAVSSFESFHTLGVRSLVIVGERGGVQGAYQFGRYASDVMRVSEEVAFQLNLNVLQSVVLEGCSDGTNGTAGVAGGSGGASAPTGNCPVDERGVRVPGQVQTFPDGHTALSLARNISALNPDALQFIVSTGGQAQHAFASLFNAFRSIGWTPKMVSWHGGGDAALRPFLNNYDDLLHTWATQPWADKLTGPNYHNEKTGSNFELFPAADGLDAPAVFSREFNARYGSSYNGGKGYNFQAVGAVVPLFGFHALTIAQKLIEAALTADVGTLVTTAPKLSVPSAYGQLQFDTTGRTQRINQVLLQYVPTPSSDPSSAMPSGAISSSSSTVPHSVQLIAPYGIGVPPVYPLPTWHERVFRPQWYADPLEQMMAAINTLCIILCATMLAVVLRHRSHPVIRAATPSLCALTILGAIIMLISTYFRTLNASNFSCAASPWLLSIGFTLLFASLFLKTYRIWRILFSRLTQVRMQDRDVLLALLGFVLLDVALNVAWQTVAGMEAIMVSPDPLRPAYNYMRCTSSSAYRAFIYAHLVLKCGLLLCAIVLTWAVRRTPTNFNESTLLTWAFYNCTLVLIFILPMIGAGLGGRKVTMLLRAFAIMFVAVATVGILFVPKIAEIYLMRKGALRRAHLSVCHSGVLHVHAGQQGAGFVSGSGSHLEHMVRSRHTMTRSSQHRQPQMHGNSNSSRQSSPSRRPSVLGVRDLGTGGGDRLSAATEMQVLHGHAHPGPHPQPSQQVPAQRRKSLTAASSAATMGALSHSVTIASTTTTPGLSSRTTPPSMLATLSSLHVAQMQQHPMHPMQFVPSAFGHAQQPNAARLHQHPMPDLPPPALRDRDVPLHVPPTTTTTAVGLGAASFASSAAPGTGATAGAGPAVAASSTRSSPPLQPATSSLCLSAAPSSALTPQEPLPLSPPNRDAHVDHPSLSPLPRPHSGGSGRGAVCVTPLRLSISPVAEVSARHDGDVDVDPTQSSPIPGAVDSGAQHGQYPEDEEEARDAASARR